MRSLPFALTTIALAAQALPQSAAAAAAADAAAPPRVIDLDDDGQPLRVGPDLLDWGSDGNARRAEAEMAPEAKKRAEREALERQAAAGGAAAADAQAQLARLLEETRVRESELRVETFVRTKARIELHFRKLDTDGNGQLALSELATSLSKIGKTAKEINSVYAALDTNEDKRVSAAEFVHRLLGDLGKTTLPLFDDHDSLLELHRMRMAAQAKADADAAKRQARRDEETRAMFIRYALYGLAVVLALVGGAVAFMVSRAKPLAGAVETEDAAVVRERARQAAEERAK